MPTPQKNKWRSVFSRVKDSDEGEPRFYIRGTRSHLFAYDGYSGMHENLNKIIDFLGGNKKSFWEGSDSPLNISTYEYVDFFISDDDESNDRLEIYGGNYMFYEIPQGAHIVGFKLFRALVSHLNLSQPRTLKRELPSRS